MKKEYDLKKLKVKRRSVEALEPPNLKHRSLPIGIFDSGMGGLTVLRELVKYLPNESYIYLGDTARLPYGTKSKETVIKYALQLAEVLVEHSVKLFATSPRLQIQHWHLKK